MIDSLFNHTFNNLKQFFSSAVRDFSLVLFFKFQKMKTIFLPVDPDYYEPVEQAISLGEMVTVHYFGEGNSLKNVHGIAEKIITTSKGEDFIRLSGDEEIRLDRIIVFDGKPGPAFDEYDSYALACLDCTGGMD